MKLWAAALALTAFLVGPARANGDLPPPSAPPPSVPSEPKDDMPHPPPGEARCEFESGGRCVVNRDDLDKLRAMAHVAIQEAKRLQAENDKLRSIKGCAKLTVLPRT